MGKTIKEKKSAKVFLIPFKLSSLDYSKMF